MSIPPVVIRRLPGLTDYATAVTAMQRFSTERRPDTPDELWLLQHPPVYTLGLNTDPAHLLGTGTIPVVQTDRGGQVTYHGPGQLIAYVMVDLVRAVNDPDQIGKLTALVYDPAKKSDTRVSVPECASLDALLTYVKNDQTFRYTRKKV